MTTTFLAPAVTGDDWIHGGDGSDYVRGGLGDDTIYTDRWPSGLAPHVDHGGIMVDHRPALSFTPVWCSIEAKVWASGL